MYNPNHKFNLAKEKLVMEAVNTVYSYLLNKYGSAKLGEPTVELSHQDGPVEGTFAFNGTISVKAAVEGYDNLNVNMAVVDNNLEVESESSITDKIEMDLGSAAEYLSTDQVVHAALDSFHLTDIGNGYLSVGHRDIANIVELGIVAKNEYATSPDKSELLQTIVKDAFTRIASQLPTKYEFTGSFVEPKIEKKAEEIVEAKYEKPKTYPCPKCGDELDAEGVDCRCGYTTNHEPEPKKSWLTADIHWDETDEVAPFHECPNCMAMNDSGEWQCGNCGYEDPSKPKAIAIQKNMPLAKAADHLAQSNQAEEQFIASQNEKIKDLAVNSLVALLHSMNYCTAKIAEVSMVDNKIDTMVTLDDSGTTKAVNIPVEIKAGKVVLPKKSLVATLVAHGMDINAKLSESFAQSVLEKLASIDEKVSYEQNLVDSIITGKVEKTAGDNGFNSPQFMDGQDSITLQKHLLPAGEWKHGDVVYADNQYWKLSDTNFDQNSKGKDDASQYHFVKCEAPKSDSKVTNIKV